MKPVCQETTDRGRARELIRLCAASLAAFIAGAYVLAHNALMLTVVLPCGSSAERLDTIPTLTRLCGWAGPWWFAVPVSSLVLGLWLRRRRRATWVAVLCSATWLLSFCWVLLAQLAWVLPALPLCSPLRP